MVNLNQKSLSAIVMLIIIGIGLGIVSAQWVTKQPPDESTVGGMLLSNNTYIKVSYISGGGMIQQADFKELTAEERKVAIDIALADSKVQKMLNGSKYDIISVMSITIQSDDTRDRDRRVLVSINIQNQSNINIVVNMDKKIVDQSEWGSIPAMPFTEQPTPLAGKEKQKAIDIALADLEVQKILNGRKYNITKVMDIPLVGGEVGYFNYSNGTYIDNDLKQGYAAEQELNLSQDMYDRHALVFIDLLNESNRTKAHLQIMVNLNTSVMKNLNLEKD